MKLPPSLRQEVFCEGASPPALFWVFQADSGRGEDEFGRNCRGDSLTQATDVDCEGENGVFGAAGMADDIAWWDAMLMRRAQAVLRGDRRESCVTMCGGSEAHSRAFGPPYVAIGPKHGETVVDTDTLSVLESNWRNRIMTSAGRSLCDSGT